MWETRVHKIKKWARKTKKRVKVLILYNFIIINQYNKIIKKAQTLEEAMARQLLRI